MGKLVFISYGTVDAADIAEWMVRELSARGYDAWWDRKDLPQRAGSSWDRQIEEAIQRCDAFIALMSPHSVRERGECRNEIHYACDRDKRVVPVLARRCDRPLRLASLQYVDFEGFADLSPEARRERLEFIVQAIEEGPREDPACAALHRHFPRFNFDWMYARHRHFVGREWILDRFDQWLKDDEEPVLFLVGAPGVGKSALLTHWIANRMGVGAVHFCRYDNQDLRNPEAMVASIAGQLLRHDIPSHREALEAFLADARSAKDAASMMDRLVIGPLMSQSISQPWVLAVDALDEGGEAIYELLARAKPYLSASKLRLLVTSRPEADILQHFEHKIVLSATDDQNKADVRKYVDLRLSEITEAAALSEADREMLARQIVEHSEGTFLIAQVTLDELERGRLGFDEIMSMSSGLRSTYAAFLGRRYPSRADFAATRSVIDVLMAAREPVSDDFVSRVLGVSARSVAEALHPLESLIPCSGKKRLRVPFHKSLWDWFEVQQPGSKFDATRERGVEAIAKAWLDGADLGDYAMRWGVAHLHEARAFDAARARLIDLEWLQDRIDKGMGSYVLSDLETHENDSCITELAGLARQRMPIWLAGASDVRSDSINQSAIGSLLHLESKRLAPLPFFEVLTERPGSSSSNAVAYLHERVEFVLPIASSISSRDGDPRLVTFCSGRFKIWDQAGRIIRDGPLVRGAAQYWVNVRLDVDHGDHVAIGPSADDGMVGIGGDFALAVHAAPGASRQGAPRWFVRRLGEQLVVLRVESPGAHGHGACAVFDLVGADVVPRSDASLPEAVASILSDGVGGSETGAVLFVRTERSMPERLHPQDSLRRGCGLVLQSGRGGRSLLVCSFDGGITPKYSIQADSAGVIGPAMPILVNGRIISRSLAVCSKLNGGIGGAGWGEGREGQPGAWLDYPPLLRDVSDQPMIYSSPRGLSLAWVHNIHGLVVYETESGRLSRLPIDEPLEAFSWSPCDSMLAILLKGYRVVVFTREELVQLPLRVIDQPAWVPRALWSSVLPSVIGGDAECWAELDLLQHLIVVFGGHDLPFDVWSYLVRGGALRGVRSNNLSRKLATLRDDLWRNFIERWLDQLAVIPNGVVQDSLRSFRGLLDFNGYLRTVHGVAVPRAPELEWKEDGPLEEKYGRELDVYYEEWGVIHDKYHKLYENYLLGGVGSSGAVLDARLLEILSEVVGTAMWSKRLSRSSGGWVDRAGSSGVGTRELRGVLDRLTAVGLLPPNEARHRGLGGSHKAGWIVPVSSSEQLSLRSSAANSADLWRLEGDSLSPEIMSKFEDLWRQVSMKQLEVLSGAGSSLELGRPISTGNLPVMVCVRALWLDRETLLGFPYSSRGGRVSTSSGVWKARLREEDESFRVHVELASKVDLDRAFTILGDPARRWHMKLVPRPVELWQGDWFGYHLSCGSLYYTGSGGESTRFGHLCRLKGFVVNEWNPRLVAVIDKDWNCFILRAWG